MTGGGLRAQLAVLSLNIEPVGVAMGAGFYRIYRPGGCQGLRPKTSSDPLIYPSYEDALRNAWTDVLGGLHDDAHRMGAHGLLGVAVTHTWEMSGTPVYQLQLSGTAVRVPGQPPTERPFLSTLSMPDFLKLLLGGWAPCGIAWGVAATHVHGWASTASLQGAALANVEMAAPTACMQLARSRLEDAARTTLAATGGDGAVGMTITLNRLPQACGNGQGVLVDGLILGTAVTAYRLPTQTPSAALDLARRGS